MAFLFDASNLRQNDYLHEPVVFENVISPEMCDALVAAKTSFEKENGAIQAAEEGRREEYFEDPKIRVVDTYSFDWEDEGLPDVVFDLYTELEAIVTSANEDYDFDLVGICETVNFLHYHTNTGMRQTGHYVGHTDFGPEFLSTRKLTTIIQLTDGNEYEGCTLNLPDWGDAPREKGSAIVFPSYMYHKVSRITKGERHCLNLWSHGPAFR